MSDPTRYRVANNQAQLTLGGNILAVDPFGPLVDYIDYARLKAEVERLAREQRLKAIPVEAQLLDRIKELKAEVERLKGIILAQSSEFVCNATKREAEPLPDGWNSSIAKACDLLAEKEKEIARLKAEVERLTNLKSGADYFKAEEGKHEPAAKRPDPYNRRMGRDAY